jgi:triosephosphate isomerase
MDSQDVTKISHEAKRETEAFINNHINDQAKGWPVIHGGSVDTGSCQKKNVTKSDMLQSR